MRLPTIGYRTSLLGLGACWQSSAHGALHVFLQRGDPRCKLLPRVLDRVEPHQLLLVPQIRIAPPTTFAHVRQIRLVQLPVPLLDFLRIRHLEQVSILDRALDIRRRPLLPHRLVGAQDVRDVPFPIQQAALRKGPEQDAERGAIFNGHGSALGLVGKCGVARIAEEGDGVFGPGLELGHVADLPLQDIVVHALQESFEVGVPALEAPPHLRHVGGRGHGVGWEVVGTEEDEVPDRLVAHGVEDGVAVGAPPVSGDVLLEGRRPVGVVELFYPFSRYRHAVGHISGGLRVDVVAQDVVADAGSKACIVLKEHRER